MPGKNALKQYLEDSYYHLYNRGVEKRLIFLDEQDYAVFLSYLKEYLTPKDEEDLTKRLMEPNITPVERDKILKRLRLNNFYGEIMLLAYCLMPNHFHLFIRQKSAGSIDKFMRSLGTRYTMYFNRKYKRVGCLYQSVYKAVVVDNEEQFLHLSRYIHKQAMILPGESLEDQPSSYPEYLGKRRSVWVHPDDILVYFSKVHPQMSYESFVSEEDDFKIVEKFFMED